MEEPQRRIRALHTATTVTVYQAYSAVIGRPALRESRFTQRLRMGVAECVPVEL